MQVVGTGKGGRWYYDQVRDLRSRGHELLLVTSGDGPLTQHLTHEGYRVETVRFRGSNLADQWGVMQETRRLVHIAMDWGADVVHAHGHKAGLVARLAASRPGFPPVLTQATGAAHLTSRRFRTLERLTLPLGAGVIASCGAIADQYSELTSRPVFVNYYGLDTGEFTPGRTGALKDLRAKDGLVVGMVAHMYPSNLAAFADIGIKGHEVFIDAASIVARQFPDVKFVVVGSEFDGDGRYEEALVARAKACAGDRIVFLGHRNDVADLVADMDVLVVPSLSESASYAAIEAGLLEVPVVASRVGGLVETIVDGQTGVLVAAGDPCVLADAITDLLSDEARREELGRAARHHCIERFDFHHTGDRLESIYGEILDGDG